ncbi:UDP-N-acetylmuramate dehydrogenase [Candidatus Peregrinibacteria bacterium]|nr:UDP-N-acetylmuramate dehydrogenase [Candidatus Peregrinibacteria bacterium]
MLFEKLKERFPGIRQKEPLKNHCTFRVGGPADLFYELTNIEEIPELIAFTEENSIPYRIIGRGTNVLFTDKGFRGLIIKNLSNEYRVDGEEISANSGALLSQIIRLSIDNNLSGLEPLYGLPGTIGGAVWGNAGIPGTEIKQFVKKVVLFNASDGVREMNADEISFQYRKTSLQDAQNIIMHVVLRLQKGHQKASKELMKKIDEIRRGKQPIGYTAGSFFKNPSPEKPAGWLIDQAGLKGTRIGDAEISAKHANFFMNTGHATALQIFELAELAKTKVKEKFSIDLEMEVKIIGDL